MQAPTVDNISNVAHLAGRRIVTSFPNLAKKFFEKYENASTGQTKIKFVSGSVEAACGLGLADAVVDLVETGTTMRAAGLEIVENVMETEAVLIANPKSTHLEILNTIKQRIQGYITATKYQVAGPPLLRFISPLLTPSPPPLLVLSPHTVRRGEFTRGVAGSR